MIRINVQTDHFDTAKEIDALKSGNPAIGGVVSFIGYMRDHNEGDKVFSMTLEHYQGMTENALLKIAEEAQQRWSLDAITIIHRVGEMLPEDAIVLVITASAHRQAAFESCEFIMDYLKNRAPFWKKESTASGERWVQARQTDKTAEQRWQIK